MNIIIGLTGPTGSGKSSASKACLELGLKLVDCDKIARIAVEKDSDGLKAVVSAFGKGILNTDGTLNRKALAKIAFSSKEKTALLNDTIFPFIKELVLNETKQGKILLDAPTLFESGINEICFKTIAVLSDKQNRLERIIKRDSITKEEALLRMSAGKDDDFYLKNADYIIYNNHSEDIFLSEFKHLISEILGEDL
ncbi:MAG: dephospho-CoA kinase [Clostridia bacterium]|nr:dephospho-CoA kinase [Clostridia bacterium]MBR4099754.1 dephospho-CoA kinase [Clostridia bacterium]